VTETAPGSEQFMDLVSRLITAQPELTPIQAGIVVAAEQNIARDSRTLARLLGLAHALVLRELNVLLQSDDVLELVKRDDRTLRTYYKPGKSAERHRDINLATEH
jgi:sulfur transfer complex TusBCD TusB component (DsrH family)|tara:strand:- start:1065 stop:1379 length:315 start_codon:yes stop_codon:yes gene_type:complete